MEVLNVILNTLGILGIIVFGAFILILIIDLLLSLCDKTRDGIFIKHEKQESSNNEVKETNNEVFSYNDEPKKKEKVVKEEPIVEINYDDNKSSYNLDKAMEEEKLLENSLKFKDEEENNEPIFTNLESMVDDDSDDFFNNDDEDELDGILNELSKKLAENNDAEQKVKEENVQPIIEIEPIKEEPEKVEEVVEEKIEEKVEEVKPEPEPKTIVKERVVYLDNDENIKQLRNLRKEVLTNKNTVLKKAQIQDQENEELNEKLKELEELKNFKRKVQSEKGRKIRNRVQSLSDNNEILKENQTQRRKNKKLQEEKEQLKEEKEQLVKQLNDIKDMPVEEDKPYFTRDYYVSKLEQLEKELSDTNKELRANKREYNPIVKCKKVLTRDGEKLRKKEMTVAKQKVSLFGVNSPKKVDPDKKAKLDLEMEKLKELKDSVLHCEEVINKNKDRFPILERSNKLLTKQVDRLEKDIESVKNAIKWYDEH